MGNIGVFKKNALRSELVENRCFDVGFPVASQLVSVILGYDEKNVWRLCQRISRKTYSRSNSDLGEKANQVLEVGKSRTGAQQKTDKQTRPLRWI